MKYLIRITQKAKQNMRRIICEARMEGLKAQGQLQYMEHICWWWNQNWDGLFQSVKMSSGLKWAWVTWIHTYWWFVNRKDFPNVHFLLHVAERRRILGHSGNSERLQFRLEPPRTPDESLERQSSEDFRTAVLLHLWGVLPNRVRYVLHTVRLARQVLRLCLQISI